MISKIVLIKTRDFKFVHNVIKNNLDFIQFVFKKKL